MKNWLLAGALALASTVVLADDVSEAKKLVEQKQLPQAKQAYTKLAEAGNAEAQYALGEMYWYGDAGPVDNGKAEYWFKQAAAKGDAKAQAALKVMAARVARKNEIAFYTERFEANELNYTASGCTKPNFPESSITKGQISEVDAAFKKWYDCHSAWVAKLNQALPAGKAIPRDLSDIMSDDDIAAAQARMGKVYGDQATIANASAESVMMEQARWRTATADAIAKREAIIAKNVAKAKELGDQLGSIKELNQTMQEAAHRPLK